MSELNAPYRYDVVGSFLRPEALKRARADFKAGLISQEQLTAVEDEAIRDLAAKQKAAGYHIITDGEFRRGTWHLDFMWGFEGVTHELTFGNSTFEGEVAPNEDVHVVDRIGSVKHPFVEHFKFIRQFEDGDTVAKQTMPSPAQTFAQFTGVWENKQTYSVYASKQELIDDLVKAYVSVLHQLSQAGCRIVQFDDCVWGGLVNEKVATGLTGLTREQLPGYIEDIVNINNAVIAAKPEGMTINIHVCRGNFHSTYFSSGPYDTVAEPLFGRENVNAYYLEYDDVRSGGFEPLRFVSGDKKVVLGLITSKFPQLEDKAAVIARIHEAAKYVPLERLYLSPQCGFASSDMGNKLTEEDQWAKLRLVKEIAQEVWGV